MQPVKVIVEVTKYDWLLLVHVIWIFQQLEIPTFQHRWHRWVLVAGGPMWRIPEGYHEKSLKAQGEAGSLPLLDQKESCVRVSLVTHVYITLGAMKNQPRVTWSVDKSSSYPGVNVYITMGESPFLMGKLTISMAMFNSYVCLPEGI